MNRLADPAMKEIVTRLSRSSLSLREVENESQHEQQETDSNVAYENAFIGLGSPSNGSSPQTDLLAHLEVGGTGIPSEEPIMNVWDRRWFGLVIHSVVIGIVSTVLPLCIYPFLTCNLNMEGTQTLSARTLLGLPWALKPILSLILDCFPLPTRYRLRFSMQLGWAVTAAALIAIFFRTQPKPFFQDRRLIGTPLRDLSTQMNEINLEAPAHGSYYILLMCIASLGSVVADVAADKLIRDVAIHHSGVLASEEDNVFQPVLTKYRVFSILSCFPFMGIGMSGWDYGGDFDFSLEYTQVMFLIGLASLVPTVLLSFTVSESPRDRRSFNHAMLEIWSLIHNCGFNHVLLCRFLGGIFAGVSATAVNPIAFYYAGVQPLNDTVVSFVAISVVLWALHWVDKKGWNVNYRTVIVVGTISTLALDLGATMLTIWDIVRSQWLWIGLPVMEAIPSALDYTISTAVLAAMVDPNARSTMSGLVTSVSFLAGPLGLALSKYVDAQFDVSNQEIMTDTTQVRERITATFFIAYAMQLASLLWLLALPRSSSEAHDSKVRSGTSTVRGVGLLLLLVGSFLFVVTVHVLSVYEPTACLIFSGGAGCTCS